MAETNLFPPFTHAVDNSQYYFRLLLKSMSEPGHIINISEKLAEDIDSQPELIFPEQTPIHPSTWMITQALFDNACSVYLSKTLSDARFIHSLQFYTDVHVTDRPLEANFAIINLDEFLSLQPFRTGDLEKPHESATLIIQVENIKHTPTTAIEHTLPISLSGPGIQDQQSIVINGFSAEHFQLLTDNRALYPCGVDIIFTTATRFLALPRSTSLSIDKSEA